LLVHGRGGDSGEGGGGQEFGCAGELTGKGAICTFVRVRRVSAHFRL
jgi:hypothetical protein